MKNENNTNAAATTINFSTLRQDGVLVEPFSGMDGVEMSGGITWVNPVQWTAVGTEFSPEGEDAIALVGVAEKMSAAYAADSSLLWEIFKKEALWSFFGMDNDEVSLRCWSDKFAPMPDAGLGQWSDDIWTGPNGSEWVMCPDRNGLIPVYRVPAVEPFDPLINPFDTCFM